MIDSGDTAFILLASALVLLMTPGLAFFYGGLVRRKSVVGVIMHSFMAMGIVGVVWVVWGYYAGLRTRPGQTSSATSSTSRSAAFRSLNRSTGKRFRMRSSPSSRECSRSSPRP